MRIRSKPLATFVVTRLPEQEGLTHLSQPQPDRPVGLPFFEAIFVTITKHRFFSVDCVTTVRNRRRTPSRQPPAGSVLSWSVPRPHGGPPGPLRDHRRSKVPRGRSRPTGCLKRLKRLGSGDTDTHARCRLRRVPSSRVGPWHQCRARRSHTGPGGPEGAHPDRIWHWDQGDRGEHTEGTLPPNGPHPSGADAFGSPSLRSVACPVTTRKPRAHWRAVALPAAQSECMQRGRGAANGQRPPRPFRTHWSGALPAASGGRTIGSRLRCGSRPIGPRRPADG